MRKPAAVALSIAALGAAAVAMPAVAATPPVATSAQAATGALPGVDLRVDANRDGTVDLAAGATSADAAAEDAATPQAGALFLPNIDDDGRRCPTAVVMKRMPKAPPIHTGPGVWTKAEVDQLQARNRARDRAKLVIERRVDACNDSSDAVVNGPEDAKDLAPIMSVPQPGVSDAATGTVEVTSGAAHVRVFLDDHGTWTLVTPQTRLNAAALRSGVRLGIEGRDIARDLARWDGTAQITLTVTDGAATGSDAVTMRVAPMLAQNNTQRTTAVYVAPAGKGYPSHRRFIADLRRAAADLGVPGGAHVLKGANDTWLQDYLEPMYASIPSPAGTQSMRLLVRSDQTARPSDRLYQLRGPGVGVVWMGPPREGGTLDSFGNLEAVPPYTKDGTTWTAGRVVFGRSADTKKHGTVSPTVRTLLAAQGMQNPIYLDTGFLEVAHIDEIMQVIPANNARGWKIAMIDPRAAVDVLRQMKAKGAGGERISPMVKGRYAITVDQALRPGVTGLVRPNMIAAKAMDANVATIKKELGLSDDDIVRVPVLSGHVEDPEYDNGYETSVLPNALNNLVMTKDTVFAAMPHATRVGGRDLMADAIVKAYAGAGVTVRFVDDFNALHMGDGDVHCGTNSLRDVSAPWWR